MVPGFRRVGRVQQTLEVQLKYTFPAVLPTLTRSRGKYFRVGGIHSDGSKEREISVV